MLENNHRNFYQKLNIATNPINSDFLLSTIDCEEALYNKWNIDHNKILKKDIIEIFSGLGLVFDTVVAFVLPVPRMLSETLLHIDLVRRDDRWQRIYGAINWELTTVPTYFEWWETSKEEIWPNNPKTFHINPHGVHYGSRFKHGIDEKTDTKLHEIKLTDFGPLLVRTDIPHTVRVNNQIGIQRRLAISLRFKNEFTSWEHINQTLSPIIMS